MFINLQPGVIFKTVNCRCAIAIFLCCCYGGILQAQQILKGTVVERDSASAMPFVYIINKSSGNGTMSDNDGRFLLSANENDTLICSYVGFAKTYIPVKRLKPNAKGEVLISMIEMPVNLQGVDVIAFKIKPYEREYMKDIIDRSHVKTLNYFQSPITALYMQFSKEGRQIRKLAKIFEDIMVEEEVQKKLSPEILRRLTGDEHIDYEAFRKYCYYMNDYFILSHDGVDLYQPVMECYKRWKKEPGGERKQEYRAHD